MSFWAWEIDVLAKPKEDDAHRQNRPVDGFVSPEAAADPKDRAMAGESQGSTFTIGWPGACMRSATGVP